MIRSHSFLLILEFVLCWFQAPCLSSTSTTLDFDESGIAFDGFLQNAFSSWATALKTVSNHTCLFDAFYDFVDGPVLKTIALKYISCPYSSFAQFDNGVTLIFMTFSWNRTDKKKKIKHFRDQNCTINLLQL